jgi:hypothetical protein
VITRARLWTPEDTDILDKVFMFRPPRQGWDWAPIMCDWRDAKVMSLLTECPARGPVAKLIALRLDGISFGE